MQKLIKIKQNQKSNKQKSAFKHLIEIKQDNSAGSDSKMEPES